MKRIPFVAACAVTLSLLGCSDEGVYGPDDHFGVNESWIINGQLDYDHDAVVALFTDNTGCTGTIIKVTPPYAYVLTAAHCFGSSNVKWVVIGDNYNSPSSKALSVSNFSIHPSYNAQNVVYDFAMIRATGAGPTTPVIPALTQAEDNLKSNDQVEHVGYGLTSYPNGQTSERHHVVGPINKVAGVQFDYLQPTAGPCSGDSGGPNLVTASGGERVAGVISFGDQQCSQFGVSGRVSSVYNSFIAPFMGGGSSSTSSSSTSSTSASSTSSSSTSSTGQGGAPTTPEPGWVAGDASKEKYGGEILLSQCSAPPLVSGPIPAGRGRLAWLSGLLAGMVMLRRRRNKAC